jgi:hypothetical protein
VPDCYHFTKARWAAKNLYKNLIVRYTNVQIKEVVWILDAILLRRPFLENLFQALVQPNGMWVPLKQLQWNIGCCRRHLHSSHEIQYIYIIIHVLAYPSVPRTSSSWHQNTYPQCWKKARCWRPPHQWCPGLKCAVPKPHINQQQYPVKYPRPYIRPITNTVDVK